MKTRTIRNTSLLLAVAIAASLAGCTHYVKQADYDAAIAQLQNKDQQLQQQIDGIEADMEQRFSKYDARLTQLEGRIRVDTVAHFDFNKSELKDQDKPMLDDFAAVMREHHSDALVTVEGFTDPAGSRSYNKKLGQQRADAVRSYLVSQGLADAQVRAVSYGEDSNRQVEKGEIRDAGTLNRRVALVVDFAGSRDNTSAGAM